MKEHIQQTGVRPWAAEDLLELQTEPLKAIEGFFAEYGNCIVKGCNLTKNEDNTFDISAGLIGLTGTDAAGIPTFKIVPFSGITGVVLPAYFTLSHSVVERAYMDNKVKPIAYDYRGAISTVCPENGDYLELTEAGAVRFKDVIQDEKHRFTTDAERSKLNGIEVQANRYVHPAEHPASMIKFNDGKTFQEKLDEGSLKGEKGRDGIIGQDGISCSHSWNGTTLTVTSASGTSSANLKGDKGDPGSPGPQGPSGPQGPQGATGNSFLQGVITDNGTTLSAPRNISVTGTINGSAMYAPNGFFQESSDRRLKETVAPVGWNLEELQQLSIDYFYKYDNLQKQGNPTLSVGCYTDEIKKIEPLLVLSDKEGIESLTAPKIGFLALKGVQLLYERLKKLENNVYIKNKENGTNSN